MSGAQQCLNMVRTIARETLEENEGQSWEARVDSYHLALLAIANVEQAPEDPDFHELAHGLCAAVRDVEERRPPRAETCILDGLRVEARALRGAGKGCVVLCWESEDGLSLQTPMPDGDTIA